MTILHLVVVLHLIQKFQYAIISPDTNISTDINKILEPDIVDEFHNSILIPLEADMRKYPLIPVRKNIVDNIVENIAESIEDEPLIIAKPLTPPQRYHGHGCEY